MIFIFPFLFISPQAEYISAKQCNARGDYEKSIQLLEKNKKKIPYGEYAFWMAANHCSLNHKKEAQKWAEEVVGGFEKVPVRYREVAKQILYETEYWKTEDTDVGDISREMRAVGKRLANAKAGPDTQKNQAEILRRLDKLIKQKEEEAKAAAAQAKTKPEQQAKPMEESYIPYSDRAKGEVDAKRFKENADVWGKLPERQRAAAMVELTRGMPAKYRNAIESYFRQLEKTKR